MSPSAAAAMMRIVSAIFFFAALIFASGAFPGFDGLSVYMHDLLDFPMDGATGPYTKEARWFSAIGGGVFASLSALLFMIVAPAIERGDKAVIRATLISLGVWFVIDSAGSIAAGVPANAAFNVSFLVLLLAPLLAARKTGQHT